MADKGHEETEKLLKKMEKQLDEVYKEAYTEARDTATSFMAKFRVMDEEKRRLLDSGELDNSEYQRWRRTMLFQGKRYKEMADTLAADMTKTNVIAASVINGHLPEVYAINHNYGTYEIEHGGKINTQYSLYDRQTVERLIRDNPDLLPRKAAINIPKDELWNKNHINSAVMQGILQGKTVDDIAKNVAATVTDMSHTSAIRNARTMTTSAQNGGRIDSYKRAQSMGVKLVQVWMATLDSRTRHEHRQLDGQKRPIGTPFKIDGMEIEFPGDPKAEPYLVYNCRCTLIGEVEGVDYNLSDVTERDSKLGDMSYEEWKEEKKKQDNAEPAGTSSVPEGKAVEINVPSAKINKNSLDNNGNSSIIKSIDVDDYNLVTYGKDIKPEVNDCILDTMKKCEKSGNFVISEISSEIVPTDQGTPILQIEPTASGLLKLNINTEFLSGKSLDDINKLLAKTERNLANSLEEAVVHESGHAILINGKKPQEVQHLYNELAKLGKPNVSLIALKDGVECLAELEVLRYRKVEVSKELAEFYEKYMGRKYL